MFEKSFFRKKCLQERMSLNLSCVTRQISSQIEFFFKHYLIDSIGFYYPIRGEIDLREPLLTLKERHFVQQLALPCIRDGKLKFSVWSNEYSLIKDEAGVPAPFGTKEIHPQCLLIPCVAVDRDGYRLGYGGGWYDRLLQSEEFMLTIGVVGSQFTLDCLPHESHDRPLDGFVNENGFTWVKPLGEKGLKLISSDRHRSYKDLP